MRANRRNAFAVVHFMIVRRRNVMGNFARWIGTVSLALAATTVFAQSWPSRPIRVLVGFGAGGATDISARLVSEEVGKRLGQPLVIENRPGVGGLLAANVVKTSPADGYTLFSGSATGFTSVFLKDNPMDPPKELQAVSLQALGDQFMFVRSDLGVNSIKEFVAKAKANKLRHAAVGPTQHIVAAIIAKEAGFEFDNIPYKTTDQVVAALLAGDVDFVTNSIPGMPPHLQSGKVRAIATMGSSRSSLQPNVPTLKEQGVNMEFRFNLGYWAPLGTPREAVQKIGAAVAEAAKVPNVIEKMGVIGLTPVASTPEGLIRQHNAELQIYAEGAKLTGFQPQ